MDENQAVPGSPKPAVIDAAKFEDSDGIADISQSSESVRGLEPGLLP